jgi:hypothetical protein
MSLSDNAVIFGRLEYSRMARLLNWLLALVILTGSHLVPAFAEDAATDDGYEMDEIVTKATGFFGETTEGLAKAIEHVFEDHGRPNAYIEGEEISGAIGIGLRYGEGTLHRKQGGAREVYWQGPSVGFDLGGNASKVFALVYHLGGTNEIFQRFPGVEGTFYFVAGVGVNYQQSGDIILAPMRTGVGLRTGANIGYLHYTEEQSWLPF